MKTRPAAALALLAGLVVSGCAASPTTESAPKPSASATAAPVASPTPSAAPEVHTVGDTVELSSGSTVAVLDYEPASAPEAPLPEASGNHWVSIDVQVCNNSDEDSYATTNPWALRDAESRSFDSSSTGYSQFPNPQYAWGEVDLPAGECVRGWITFPVLDDVTLTTARYVSPATNERVDWTLG
ncbi:DUF4352 domain-containing protein [Microbacterium sp. 22215]|uniref:DUF4352 domain-containing protein n=1 Tax=Microbacterium sp. 22215 TaxID=3453893 RepID=UPI003F87A49F